MQAWPLEGDVAVDRADQLALVAGRGLVGDALRDTAKSAR
jgi:hypothetical protein